MHEEMHMTQMQFMNTGAWEIVFVFKKVARTLRWFAKERGSKQNPCVMHMRKAQHESVQYDNIHKI